MQAFHDMPCNAFRILRHRPWIRKPPVRPRKQQRSRHNACGMFAGWYENLPLRTWQWRLHLALHVFTGACRNLFLHLTHYMHIPWRRRQGATLGSSTGGNVDYRCLKFILCVMILGQRLLATMLSMFLSRGLGIITQDTLEPRITWHRMVLWRSCVNQAMLVASPLLRSRDPDTSNELFEEHNIVQQHLVVLFTEANGTVRKCLALNPVVVLQRQHNLWWSTCQSMSVDCKS